MTVIAPRRDAPLMINGRPTLELANFFEEVARTIRELDTQSATNTAAIATLNSVTRMYDEMNVEDSRTFDADTVTTAELADVVGTLISDLRTAGIVK